MSSSLRFAGTAALCATLLLAACAKKTDQTTTTTDTTQSTAATSAPDASATAAAEATATTAPQAPATSTTVTSGSTTVTTTTGSNGAGSGNFIDLPVYPGASELKDQGMTMSANGTSVTLKVYDTKDDTKKVAEWYKSHLPASFKGGILTSGDKTVGTFGQQYDGNGDQSVIVNSQDDKTTRIQLATKRGK
jgi:hypothetical protein